MNEKNMSTHRLISKDEVLQKLAEFDSFLARARYDAEIEDPGVLNDLLNDVQDVVRDIRGARKIDYEAVEELVQLRCPLPRVVPFGIEVTKSGVKDAWESIITPMQEEDGPMSMDWRIIMAVMRTVYGAMPEDV